MNTFSITEYEGLLEILKNAAFQNYCLKTMNVEKEVDYLKTTFSIVGKRKKFILRYFYLDGNRGIITINSKRASDMTIADIISMFYDRFELKRLQIDAFNEICTLVVRIAEGNNNFKSVMYADNLLVLTTKKSGRFTLVYSPTCVSLYCGENKIETSNPLDLIKFIGDSLKQ